MKPNRSAIRPLPSSGNHNQSLLFEFNIYLYAALDQTLDEIGKSFRIILTEQLAEQDIEYDSEMLDLSKIYNHFKTLLGEEGAKLIVALTCDKLCRIFGLGPDATLLPPTTRHDPYKLVIMMSNGIRSLCKD
jgi:hypothetical protein